MKDYPQNVSTFKGNPYRKKRSIYHPKKGHTGVDIRFKTGDIMLSPITGKVVKCLNQKQMGKTIYIKHSGTGDIHVFAHNTAFLLGIGDKVERGQGVVVTGNTGTVTTAPHVHYEIITSKPINFFEDNLMTRSLAGFKGYNTDPIPYLKRLYEKHNINFKTGESKEIPWPTWISAKVVKAVKKIPYPKWINYS